MENYMKIGIAVVIVIIIIAGYMYMYREKFTNDLQWAAGLPTNCSSCTIKNANFANPNMVTDALVNSIKDQRVDYYGYPVGPLYYDNSLQDYLYQKVWGKP